MADVSSWTDYKGSAPEADGQGSSWTYGDVGKALKSGTESVLAGGASLLRSENEGDDALASDPWARAVAAAGKELQGHLNEAADVDVQSMTPGGLERLQAPITSKEFWSHPFSSLAMKATGMAPGVVASIIPAVVVPEATMGAMLANGTINAGQAVNEIYRLTDAMSDEDLQKVPYYGQLREGGMSETSARARYNAKLRGSKDALNFLVGAVAGAIGPAGQAARAVTGGAAAATGAGRGALGRATAGGLEGGAANAVQSATSDLSVQTAAQEAGLQEGIDKEKLVNAVAEGFSLGAVIGAPLGAVAKEHAPKAPGKELPAKDTAPVATIETERTPEAVNQQTKGTGTGTQPKPAENVPVGDKHNEVSVRSAREYPKAEAAKKVSRAKAEKPNPVIEDTATPEIKAALDGDLGTPVPKPEDVMADAVEQARVAQRQQAQAAVDQARMLHEAPEVTPEVTPEQPAQPVAEMQPPVGEVPPVQVAPTPPERTSEAPRASIKEAEPAQPIVPAAEAAKPRVLEDLSPKGRVAAKSAAEAEPAVVANVKQLAKEEAGPGTKHRTKADLEKRTADATAAKKLFDDEAERTIPNSLEERQKLRASLETLLAKADEAGIKIPAKVSESTADHIVWLREAKDVLSELRRKSFVGKGADERVTSFLMRERAAKGGDFSVMRGERRAEGELASRKPAGDVEMVAAPAASAGNFDKEGVVTSAPKSGLGARINARTEQAEVKTKTGTTETVERAQAASPVRKVTVSDELKAKYAGKLAALGTTKPAEIKAKATLKRIDAIAEKTTKPEDLTPKQKETGEYKKGVVDFQGVKVAIETARGEERSKQDASGKTLWKVTMPDHYGEIHGTRGMDGDKVDAYIGRDPNAKHAYIIDQVDADTRAPDEHKVMLGYTHADQALAAYDKAFSDGKGFDRVGSVKAVTMDELKTWLKDRNATKAPTDAALEHFETTGEDRPRPLPASTGAELVTHNGETVRATHTYTLASILPKFNLKEFGPLHHFIRGKLIAGAGDVKIHLLEPRDLRKLWGKGDVAGFYRADKQGNEYIAIDGDLSHAAAVHTVIHEGVHALAINAVNRSPKLAADIQALMKEVRSYHGAETFNASYHLQYGFKNEHEFLAEAWSNVKFQEMLRVTPMSKTLAEALGLPDWRKRSMWSAFLETVRRAIGLPEGTTTALEAAISLTERAAWSQLPKDHATYIQKSRVVAALEKGVIEQAHNAVKSAMERPELQAQKGAPKLLGLRMMNQIAEMADRYGLPMVQTIHDTLERTRTGAEKLVHQQEPMLANALAMSKKYGKVFDEFASLTNAATSYGVHPDVPLTHAKNAHLHFKNTEHLEQVQPRAQHPELAARYNALPDELKALYHESQKYYKDTQDNQAMALLSNKILKVFGKEDDALAARIFRDATTDADVSALGDGDLDKGKVVLKMLQDVKELSAIKGPYFPQMRRGDYVVQAKHVTDTPPNSRKTSDGEFEFKKRDEMEAWVRKQDPHAEPRSVWVDKNTGETTFPDGTKVTPQDTDAEQRFRVAVQDKHVEFFDTSRQARAAAAELEKTLGKGNVEGVERKHYEAQRSASMVSRQMTTLLKSLQQRPGWTKMTAAERKNVTEALNEASVRFMGSTRMQSHRLPRRYVAGASKDFVRNMYEYVISASTNQARLEHAPTMEAAVKAMHEAGKNDYTKSNSLGRSAIVHEVDKRLDKPLFEESGGWHSWTKRLMTASFLDKLLGPSTSVINATQPITVTFPVLAARHGYGRTFTEMRKAYSDIGGLTNAKQGLVDTVRKFKPGSEAGSYIDDIIARAAKTTGERKMFEHLLEVGSIDPEGGLEVGKLIQASRGAGGVIDKGLGYLEGIARQMPKAMEANNRAATALSAYRLEFAKTGDHEKSVLFAQRTVNNTQFLYSHTNKPEVFKHPLARLSLQFKQYGQGMYHLMGMNVGRALMKDATPAERKEAIKTLVGIAATHAAFAGALGIPGTEPFKYLLMGANAVGLTNTSWNDVEHKARQIGAELFGKTGGELLMKGLPRALGVDVSSRMGADSWISFGEPRSNKEADAKSWLWDTVAGAPAALVTDWIKGTNALVNGHFGKAAELMIPIKEVSDSLRAYRQASEGKKGATGKETMSPYTPFETTVRALGFTPRREAEVGAQRSAFYSQQTKAKEDRTNLMSQWVGAKPSEKAQAWQAIVQWNKSQPEQTRIKMGELSASAQRRRTEESSSSNVGGIKTTKRDKYLLDNSPYQVGQ